MALTLSLVKQEVSGSSRIKTYDVTFDSSYATGGEALAPGDVGLSVIRSVTASSVGGRSFPYDRTNQKLQAYGGTTEVSNATDLSAVTTRVVLTGR